MIYLLLGLGLLVVLVLIAVYIGLKHPVEEEISEEAAVASSSGVYSIVRRSPREAVERIKPSADELRQYLASVNEDSSGRMLTEADKERLVDGFRAATEASIKEVEEGDCEGVEYYYYDYSYGDPVCESYVGKGQYITREEIYRFPQLLPPFHPGCGCVLRRQRPTDSLRNTIAMSLRPLLADSGEAPRLPDWRHIGRLL